MRSDEELMRAYREGDPGAFRELFQRYASVLVRLLARDLRQPDIAQDLVQQAFLQLHRARFDFDDTQRFKPWMFTIALNLKREYFRSRKRRPEAPAGEVPVEIAVPPLGQQRAEAQQTLSWALEKIPADQREVIELHWFGGLSFPEVAECLGIGATAAKVRAHRGYNGLRALLGDLRAARHGGNPAHGAGI